MLSTTVGVDRRAHFCFLFVLAVAVSGCNVGEYGHPPQGADASANDPDDPTWPDASGSDPDPNDNELCQGETCSGHGTCLVEDGVPYCDCDDGYEANGLACEPTEPVFPPVTDYADPGPFETTTLSGGGPGGAFTLWHPTDLGRDGLRHPVITWGNGTGAVPMFYSGLLDHWASHGFVVIASNSTMTGSGEQMVDGAEWLIAENDRAGSTFHGKIATGEVGAAGHSQGGGGTINAGNSPTVKCVAPIQPAPGSVGGLQGPMFLISGSADTIVSPLLVESMVYNPSQVPTIYGKLLGATHFTPVGSGGDMRGYLTAWFRLNLMADETADALFYGDSCGICEDPKWDVKRKNL